MSTKMFAIALVGAPGFGGCWMPWSWRRSPLIVVCHRFIQNWILPKTYLIDLTRGVSFFGRLTVPRLDVGTTVALVVTGRNHTIHTVLETNLPRHPQTMELTP